MTKATRAQYTFEFKQEAVRMVESGQSSQRRREVWEWLSKRCTTGLRRSGKDG